MHNRVRAHWTAMLLAAACSSGWGQSGRHPGYAFTTLMKAGFQPIVGDIEWMPDGRLLVMTMKMDSHNHVSGPSDLLLLDGVLKGGADAVTVKTYASGFYTPQGVKVVDGQVYVLDNKEGIIQLTDANKDDVAEARKVVWSEGIKNSDRKWSGGLAFKDGFFYVPISTRIIEGGRSDPTQGKWNGSVAKIAKDGSGATLFAGGLRNSNGIGWGPGGEMIVTDNQGDWTPCSRVNEVRQGEFFGHEGTAFADKPMTNPIVWLPHSEVANSPSNTLFLHQGRYKGQMLIGEVTQQRILRANLEKVGGRLQGCVFPFATNMPAGVQRLLEAKDGSGSIIVAGVGGDGGWTFKTPWYDLERLTPTANVPFEMFAVRCKGANTLEVEFTKPIATADAIASRFAIQKWRYQPTADYGGPKLNPGQIAVSGVALSADGLKATLTVSGLATGFVIYIKLVGMKSKDGETPYATDAYYTLNAFGPGEDLTVDPVGLKDGAQDGTRGPAASPWAIRNLGSEALVKPPMAGPFALRLLSPDGRVKGTFAGRREGSDWVCRLPLNGLKRGSLLLLEARGAEGASRAKWIAP